MPSDEFVEPEGQCRQEPCRQAHRPRKCDKPHVALRAIDYDFRRLVRLHEKRHRAGVAIRNARAYEAGADRAYRDALFFQHSSQRERPGFHRGLCRAVGRARGERPVARDRRRYEDLSVRRFCASAEDIYRRQNHVEIAVDVPLVTAIRPAGSLASE